MSIQALQSQPEPASASATPEQSRFTPLKIAIVHPTNWPQVRRGTERYMNEMASYLSHRGHQVKIICSHPARRKLVNESGYITDYHRSLWRPFLARWGVLDYHVFPLTTLGSLLRERFDLAHCFNFTDALAATWARSFTGVKVVLHLTALPPSVPYRRTLSTGGLILCKAIQAVDGLISVSQEQRRYFESRCHRQAISIPGPVDTEAFGLSPSHAEPVIVCASALEDPRKGGRLLMRGFSLLKERRPEARLRIASSVSDGLQAELLDLVPDQWRRDVEFLTETDSGSLPRLLGSAAVVVVPSLWETVSLVILEALATGTPVVATQQEDGSHEVLNPLIGRTFEPGPTNIAEPSNVDGLAQAMFEAIDLSRQPETARRCRQVAERYAWQSVGPQYEAVYQQALGRTPAYRGEH